MEHAWLRQHGWPGHATVVALRDTGVTVNENPELELRLAVWLEGRRPYAVTHRQVIARIALEAVQPGSTVPVRIDPDDPQALVIA